MGVFEHFPYTNFHDLNTDWILKIIKELDAEVDNLEEWRATHEVEYAQLKAFMDSINAGNMPPALLQSMKNWLNDNAYDIIGSYVKFVNFGLNDNGYFIVTIPEPWRDLIFKTTGLDFNTSLQPDYGHLCILY